ncbi:enoyl-CoA hydratase-related protein [Actinomadura sp. KC345]|uniref:enoyl-CoA hydratase-related protein n=1 Tax=Actinomadura sp. KC345 TaxID=2530371 RepID=UPI001A9DCBC6|nr:enoyl-CoA hydratase-related protein [Actinomadura sp. KC345]
MADAVATIWLNRPAHRNAISVDMLDGLHDLLHRADADPSVRGVVVTGSGRTFSAGADLSDGPDSLARLIAGDERGHQGPDYHEPAGRVSLRIRAMTKPVIAAVNGDAIGGGATIVTAMDMRLAAERARFGFVFTRRGVTPEGASSWYLPRLVGPGRAMRWMLSGELVTTAEARTAGLVDTVLPEPDLLPAAEAIVREIAEHTSAKAVALTRRLLLDMGAAAGPEAAASAESRLLRAHAGSTDTREGIASFLERRPARFTERVPAEQVPGAP